MPDGGAAKATDAAEAAGPQVAGPHTAPAAAARQPVVVGRGSALCAWEAVAADGWGVFAGGVGHALYFPMARAMRLHEETVNPPRSAQ